MSGHTPRVGFSSALLSLLVVAVSLFPVSAISAQTESPNLSVGMIDSPDPVAPGKVLTYRITVGVAGRRAMSNIVVSTAIPPGTTFVQLRGPEKGWSVTIPDVDSVGPVTATTASLQPGRAAIFQLSVRVSPDLPTGSTVSNIVSATSSTPDPDPTDDSATATTTVRVVPPPTADLSVALDFLQQPVPSFGDLVETIVIRNQGPMAATDVKLRTTTPTNSTFVAADVSTGRITAPHPQGTGNIDVSVDVIPANRVVVLTVVVRITGNPGQHADAMVSVGASSTDPNLANNVDHKLALIVEPGPVADLAVSFVTNVDHVVANADVTYAVKVTNVGPTQAESATALVPVPTNARFISATASQGDLRMPPTGRPGSIGWRIGSLANGAFATLTVTIRTGERAGVPLIATALVTSRATDLTLGNNVAAISTRVLSLGDAVLTWEPPDADAAGLPAPKNLSINAHATTDEGLERSTAAGPAVARDDGETPLCYNIYVSSTPNVESSPENLWSSVPADQTTATVPVAPGGSFFTITTEYPSGESGSSNEAADGDTAGAVLSSVKVTSSKITAKGSGFTDSVDVLLDGIPFADPAAVKGGNAKAVQKGLLVIGMTVEQYTATGTSFLIIVRNSDGGVSTWNYEK